MSAPEQLEMILEAALPNPTRPIVAAFEYGDVRCVRCGMAPA